MKTFLESDREFICDINAPCFQQLIPEEMDLIRASKTQVLFRKGDMLSKQGAFASYVLFIISGISKQYLEGDGNRSLNMKIVLPGEFVGLSTVFTGNTFSYSTVALTVCQAYLIEKESIGKVIKQNGNFGFMIIKRYCRQHTDLLAFINKLHYKQMNGRLADVLLYIDSLKNENREIFQMLSRKDLAEFAGISTESAVKLLKIFEKDNLIRLSDKNIELTNYSALKEISAKG